MLNRLTVVAVVTFSASLISVVVPTVVFAGGVGGTTCQDHPHPGCKVTAKTPGSAPGRRGAGQPGHGNSGSGAGAPAGSVQPPEQKCMNQADPQACAGPAGGGGAPVITPAELGAQAVSQLQLPSPVIRTNPPAAGRQLVGVPTWFWQASWSPKAATAAAAGFSVTATATPKSARWIAGDGTSLSCTGPGTPWHPGTNPRLPSPTCGHVYLRSSGNAPGGRFPLTVNVTWTVSWRSADGTAAGTAPPLVTTSAPVQLTVVAAPVLNE